MINVFLCILYDIQMIKPLFEANLQKTIHFDKTCNKETHYYMILKSHSTINMHFKTILQ